MAHDADLADRLHDGFVRRLIVLTSLIPGGELIDRGTAVAAVTGLPGAYFNVAMGRGRNPRPEEFDEVVSALASSGLPYSAQLRAGADDALIARTSARAGLEPYGGEDIPGMALRATPIRTDAALEIRSGERTYEDHLSVVAVAFGIQRNTLAAFLPPGLLQRDDFIFYAGYRDGSAVAASLAFCSKRAVHITNVATIPGERGLGFGTAMTVAAASRAWNSGSDVAFLESSEMATGLYGRLGFAPVVRYELWRTRQEAS